MSEGNESRMFDIRILAVEPIADEWDDVFDEIAEAVEARWPMSFMLSGRPVEPAPADRKGTPQ